MIRMMILSLSVVLLAASGYLQAAKDPKQDADKCSKGLGDYITTICSSSNGTFTRFSECSYTCASTNVIGQPTLTTYFLPNGLPCGKCKECCSGICTPINFDFGNPLTLKSCAK